jgi:hypothetical protein
MNNTNSWKDNQGIAPVPGHDEALSDVLREMRSDPHPSRRFVHVLADRIEAALARQEPVGTLYVAEREGKKANVVDLPEGKYQLYAAPPAAQAVDLEKLRRWAELCDKVHGSDFVANEIRRAAGKGVDRE